MGLRGYASLFDALCIQPGVAATNAGGVINICSNRPELTDTSGRGQYASINLGLGSFSTRVGDATYRLANG